jgi:hypothetical protein
MDSIKFSVGKFTRIIQWSFLQATVGVFLEILRVATRRLPFLAQLLPNVLQMAWSAVTIFVLPTLVYEDVGPFRAIRQSISILRKTWGETVIQSIGLGFMLSLGVIVVFGSWFGLAFLLLSLIPPSYTGPHWMILVFFLFPWIGALIVVLLFNVANTVFKTALYVYATTGTEPSVYSETALPPTTFQQVFSKDGALSSN